jgi:hypothetical protein
MGWRGIGARRAGRIVQQAVEQEPSLQRCERVDVLHLCGAAVHTGHDVVDVRWRQTRIARQWHHLRRDAAGTRRHQAVREIRLV